MIIHKLLRIQYALFLVPALLPGDEFLFAYSMENHLSPSVSRSSATIIPHPALPPDAPWDLDELSNCPGHTWLNTDSPVRSLLYTGPGYMGNPTSVFAYYANPETLGIPDAPPPPYPGIVLVHGAGGTAFSDWVELWARRGYAALAMDLNGSRPLEGADPFVKSNRIRLPDGGPPDSEATKFTSISEDKSCHWPYHAVANVILAHSLLQSFLEVDPRHTAVTGISWGGYLTCIAAGLDNRFKAAVPVYGCGFLEHTIFKGSLDKLDEENRRKWIRMYDPSQYLPLVQIPMFFLNGTNDFAYWLDGWIRSVDALPASTPRTLRLQPGMAHNHVAGWSPDEIRTYLESVLKDQSLFPSVSNLNSENGTVSFSVDKEHPLSRAYLIYTTDRTLDPDTIWNQLEFTLSGPEATCEAPPVNVTAWFVNILDSSGQMISTRPRILPDGVPLDPSKRLR